MEPDVGIAVEKDRMAGRPRPSPLIRAVEVVGLALVIFGLGGGRLWLVLLGGALVVSSYADYRRQHGASITSGKRPDGPDSNAGSGGD